MKNTSLVTVFIASSLFFGCKNNQAVVETPVAPKISVSAVMEDSVTLLATYPGYLEATDYIDLVARVNGYQEASRYRAGRRVAKGDTLFIIEPAQYIDAVAQAEAALATAQAEFYFAENNYKRMKDVQNSNAISEIDLIRAESAYYQAEAAIKTAEAALQSARTQLSYCYVVAPFAGTPTSATFSNGDFLRAGDKLATLYKDNTMYAYFSIDDAQYMKLIQNLKKDNTKLATDDVRLTFSEPLPHDYVGHIDYIAPNIDISTGTLKVRILVNNPYGELKHGMYTTVHMPYSRREKLLIVRDASIGTDQVGKYIYVVNDSNRVEMRHIEIGEAYQDSMRVVYDGLKPGEMYVTRAIQKVREGMTISPVIE